MPHFFIFLLVVGILVLGGILFLLSKFFYVKSFLIWTPIFIIGVFVWNIDDKLAQLFGFITTFVSFLGIVKSRQDRDKN
jgi:hypothetical protein